MDLVQFVDSIDAAATVRLDLNDDVTWGANYDRTDFSPPPLKEAYAGSLLADGELQTASAYENRRLRLGLDLTAASPDAVAAELAKLWRELNRDGNLLRWQPQGMSKPVFFRTIRSSETSVTDYPGAGMLRTVDVVVQAEPFAYGLRETLATATVSNDPAVANGCFLDVTGVKGDVATPLVLTRSTTNLGVESLFAVRRRGTPANVPLLVQAESMTFGVDTSTSGLTGLSSFSGSGINYVRTSFTTTPGYADRLSVAAWPSVASVDARGTYRVFARVRRAISNTSVIKMRLRVGGVDLDEATLPSGMVQQMVDLGLMSVPSGPDPIYNGPGGAEVPVKGPSVVLQASRTGGTDALDVDYLIFVPADDRLSIAHWPVTSAGVVVADAVHDLLYGSSGTDVVSGTPGYHVGGLPMVSPGVTNRVYILNEVGVGLAEPTFPATTAWDGYYWPRYLMARGAA